MELLNMIKSYMKEVDDLDSNIAFAVRHLFTGYALLKDILPDTYEGDWLTFDLYDLYQGKASCHDFDEWLWGDLC